MGKHDIDILFEDEQVVLINKPAGLSVTADRSGTPDVIMMLNKQLRLTEPLRLVHRLDKETSGILLVAKNKTAQSRYSRLFARRTVQKLYLAIVKGPLNYTGGSIKDPIARSRRNPQAMQVHPRLGKPAHTVWKQLADFGAVSLVCAQTITGRTHQIRVHFAHRGMPLAIDALYGSPEPLMLSAFKTDYQPKPDKDEPPMISRLTLHAYQLTLPTGPEETLKTFTAPLDKKFSAVIKLLAKHTAKLAPGFINQDDLKQILSANPLHYLLGDAGE